jgi:uncharacterized membrane protein YhfC
VLTALYPLAALIMVAMPIGLALVVWRRWRVDGSLFAVGACTFVASQVVHVPMLIGGKRLLAALLPDPPLLLLALLVGLAAGLCEELTRAAALVWFLPRVRAWRASVALGVGHGGIESAFFGGAAALTFVQLLVLRDAELATAVPAEQLDAARAQLESYWGASWSYASLGAIERVFTIPHHIAWSVLVMEGVRRRRARLVLVAIAWHTATNAGALVTVDRLGAHAAEAFVGASAVLAVAAAVAYRQRPAEPPAVDPVVPVPLRRAPLDAGRDLDHTKYTS